MNTNIIVLSRCLSTRRERDSFKTLYTFHFKGVYKGRFLSEIRVIVDGREGEEMFRLLQDYLLYLKVDRIVGQYMYCWPVKVIDLDH